MNEQAAAWLSAVEGLPAVHERLRRVAFLSRDAIDVIRHQDGPRTLFYLDPPYLPSARSAPDVYRHEMIEGRHRELLALVKRVKGKVVLSGYPADLYDAVLTGWHRVTFDLANHAAGGKSKRRVTEAAWCNFTPAAGKGVPASPPRATDPGGSGSTVRNPVPSAATRTGAW
jgi:DNA adenine methylase